ncbi:putative F-box protein At1g47790 [Oryza sativa Japonica Group]|uniref:F-box domain-containing protein n=3 Tax=Oryza TaxID=4527 RepID=A3AC09_ORYSJ|nr:putative F-box protein At1g47790 [Oryza sativa Japonica Group]EAZ24848.1 hypothetical protein OsJ_08630 [Oryza sativa Japonica Group]KAF2947289.1 hypothetical protein DAI22_02g358600 [Oryza sativa Japonica Group]USI00853.1 F-box domain-containing protein [Oryza sativa Japonica Group]BAD19287.1 hypothetical protein [Oryza sativa Japonica Group]BAD19545.1 hypothetical protein [Oryza sativa Japonica Group]
MDGTRSAKRMKRFSGACPCPLPDDIVDEILSHLPVKSLLRFRCVSRRFHATITSSHLFQEAHFLQRKQRNKHPPRLFIRPPFGPRQPFFAWQWQWQHLIPRPPVEEIMTARHLPHGTIFPLASKSCHGLVLLKITGHHTHYLWNPSTRHILRLPGTDNTPPPATYGLGYCSATRRHKVVRVVGCRCCSPATVVWEVLALDGDEPSPSSSWRPPAAASTTPPPRHWHYPRENWRRGAALCNGGDLHFLRGDGDIVTFNVTDESFGVSSLKPPPELQSRDDFELTELDGCLCVYTFTDVKLQLVDEEPESPTCEIWVTREAAAGSWEKLCSIEWVSVLPPDHSCLRWYWIAPIHMFSDGNNEEKKKKKIMFATGTGHVLVFDPSVGTLEIIFSPEDEAVGEYHDYSNNEVSTLGLFEESLALVGNTSENIVFSQP